MEKKTFLQFLKFAVVGVLNTLVDWVSFFILRLVPFFAVYEVVAKGLSFWISATNSFVCNSLWTFREEFTEGLEESKSKVVKSSTYYIKFMLVSSVGFLLNVVVFKSSRAYLFVGDSFWMRLFSLALASLVVIIWNFSANKWWTYKNIKNQNVKSKT